MVRALNAIANRKARTVFLEGWERYVGGRSQRSQNALVGPNQLPGLAGAVTDRSEGAAVLGRMRWGLLERLAPPAWPLKHWTAWLHLRDAVLAAWARWGNAAGSIDRCGDDVTIMVCPACKREHPLVKTCRSRYCADCIADVRARSEQRIRDLVEKHFKHQPRFLTLTTRNVQHLAGSITRLVKAFGRLRRLTRLFRDQRGKWWVWEDIVRGGVYSAEITEDLGRRDDLVWHPHLHTLLDSQLYLPWNWLVEGWQRANGCKCPRSKNRKVPVLCRHSTWIEEQGRFVTWRAHAQQLAEERTRGRRGRDPARELVKILAANKCQGCGVEPGGLNIQAASNTGAAVHELVKYVGKSLKTSAGMMAFAPALEEFLEETLGRRMLSAFGALHGAEEREEPVPLTCDDCGTVLEFLTIMSVVAWERQQRAPPAA